MAETSLSPEEFLSKLLSDEHADVLRGGHACPPLCTKCGSTPSRSTPSRSTHSRSTHSRIAHPSRSQ